MDKLRVGVIGAKPKGIGGHRCQRVVAHPKAELVAVSNTPRDALEEVTTAYGVPGHEDYHDLLARDDVDAVIVSTPNCLHYRMSREALAAGKHVCVEYPMCDTLERHDELTALASEKGRVLHHGMNVRHEFLFQTLQENLDQIGDPIHAHVTCFSGRNWYRDAATRGNMYVALHIHFVEYFSALLGAPEWVEVAERPLDADSDEDWFAQITMGHRGGKVISTNAFGTGLDPSPAWLLEIIGAGGSLSGNSKSVRLTTAAKTETIPNEGHPHHILPCTDNFIAEVVDGAPPDHPLDYSRRLIEICLKCDESARLNRRVEL